MILHENTHDFDVAILGSGMSGSMLAAILAKKGVQVVLIDSETHPRFAVGESTIPHTSLLISLLAEKYGMPEIEHIAYPERLADHVATTCGIKRSFGFAFHREEQIYDSREGLQFGTSSKDENHWFRQDIDAYLLHLAVHHGAVPRLRTKVTSVRIDDNGVQLQTSQGEAIRARYLVDGSGFKSLVADLFDLREMPTRLKHHSRSMFTHMIDVPPFEEDRNPLSLSWHQSTLHHCFERGWFWVIPFNNHPRSSNPLISIGLTIDPRRYPKGTQPAEQEFAEFLAKFPSVAEQFANAKAVRPWISTDRLQYSSKRTVGYRYCLMSHAAGAVDPLFSRGMINTLEVIQALIDPLLNALAEDNFDQQRFAHIEQLQQRVLDYNDNLVNGAFISWADFDIWNAWLRVWALGTVITEFRVMKVLNEYSRSHDENCLHGEAKDPAFSTFEDPDYSVFFAAAVELIEAFEQAKLSAAETSRRIFDLAGGYDFPVMITRESMLRAGWLKEEDFIRDRDVEFARRGFRWALTNPQTRDLFGNQKTFFRWFSRRPDPHLLDDAAPTTRSAD
ncbi:MAG TPA: tryptophan 7-halogenase [Terriglobales bacterium]|nr:tryptophan 7-halogenase [Terriglobales bacterium]